VPTSVYNGSGGPAAVSDAINKAIAGHAKIRALTSETPTTTK